jgi:hypothetical protein
MGTSGFGLEIGGVCMYSSANDIKSDRFNCQYPFDGCRDCPKIISTVRIESRSKNSYPFVVI